jgi:hypothetical protein
MVCVHVTEWHSWPSLLKRIIILSAPTIAVHASGPDVWPTLLLPSLLLVLHSLSQHFPMPP